MKNNKFFSFRLYLDGIKQLSIIGVVSFLIMLFCALFVNNLSSVNGTVFIGSLTDMFPMAVLSYMFIIPVMTLYLFSFLTKRNGSDFYHSIPKSRLCIYTSYLLSIVTWVVGILLVCTATAIIRQKFFTNNRVTFDYSAIFTMLISIIVCCLLVAAAITVAQGLTGTIFTNVAVSGIIIFIPRIFIYCIISVICQVCPYLNSDYFFFLFNEQYNLVTCSVQNLMFTSLGNCFSFVPGIFYTLALACIYFIIGGTLFCKKKSETAGFSALNRFVQASVRCIFCLTACLIPLTSLFTKLFSSNRTYSAAWSDIIIGYIIALFVYFIYELLSTRKVKNVIKAIPALAIVIALNIIVVSSVYLMVKRVESFEPDASEIEYIRVLPDSNMAMDVYNYLDVLASDIRLTDPELKQIAATALRNTKKDFDDYQFYDSKIVEYHVDGKSYYREVNISDSGWDALQSAINSDGRLLEQGKKLPSYSSASVSMYNSDIKAADVKKLYESFRRELASLPDDKFKEYLEQPSQLPDILNGCFIIRFTYNGKIVELEFSLSEKLPETYNQYLEIMYLNSLDFLERTDITYYRSDQSFTIYRSDGTQKLIPLFKTNWETYHEENLNYLKQILQELKHCTEIPSLEKRCEYIVDDNYNIILFVPTEEMTRLLDEVQDANDKSIFIPEE